MNNTQLIGRLTAKPELRYTESQKAVCSFTLAVPRTYNRDETDFINCVAWNKSAEVLEKYCDKGSRIAVVGRIQVRDYETENGKRYTTEVIAENIEFLDTKKKEDAVVEETKGNRDVFEEFGNEVVIDDDSLPF